jgi:hypothetical protein
MKWQQPNGMRIFLPKQGEVLANGASFLVIEGPTRPAREGNTSERRHSAGTERDALLKKAIQADSEASSDD